MKKKYNLILCVLLCICLSGCAMVQHQLNELNGTITGNTYLASFYSNNGEKFMTMSGQKIDIRSNFVKEYIYDSGKGIYMYTVVDCLD